MKTSILKFMILLIVALITQTSMAVPVTKADSVINAKMQGVERVREKIDKTLDDTIASQDGWAVEMTKDGDMTPEDIKEISTQWANVVKDISIATIIGFLLLLLMIMLFRYLTRRRKYDVMEKAIMNNYPLNDLALNETKHSAIYVPQPVITNATQPGQVPVGNPIGQPVAPVTMTAMPNWRALMPAVKWIAWGLCLFLFGCCVCDFDDPFWPVGLALIFVGLCKGYILHKEQKVLQEAWDRNVGYQQQEPMREGIPVPPPMNDYNSDFSAND